MNDVTRSLDEKRQQRTALSEAIQMEIRKHASEKFNDKMTSSLSSNRAYKAISNGFQGKRTKAIPQIKDADGRIHHDGSDIDEVFACFYADLYRSRLSVDKDQDSVMLHGGNAPPFTKEELRSALKQLRNRKSADNAGIVAEYLKVECDTLSTAILDLFNDIFKADLPVPREWRKSRVTVIFKKGDATLPQNYRPVAIISVLCKLFSIVLLGRVKPILESIQEEEQAGFRTGYGCSDVIHVLRMLAEKAHEWGEELWVASLDLEKAFDKVFHTSVLECLSDAGVDSNITRSLWLFYAKQVAYVRVDGGICSRKVAIERGVRQGDPLSPILFNNVPRKYTRY